MAEDGQQPAGAGVAVYSCKMCCKDVQGPKREPLLAGDAVSPAKLASAEVGMILSRVIGTGKGGGWASVRLDADITGSQG